MPIEIEDNTDNVIQQIARKSGAGLADVCQAIYKEHLKRITKKKTLDPRKKSETSNPGEYPHTYTGQGADSLDWDVDRKTLSGFVGYRQDAPKYPPHTSPGGGHMEVLRAIYDRKGIDHTVFDIRSSLITIFTKRFKATK